LHPLTLKSEFRPFSTPLSQIDSGIVLQNALADRGINCRQVHGLVWGVTPPKICNPSSWVKYLT
jgi:hypothetical protein